MNDFVIFNDKPIERNDLVATAKSFLGLPYTHGSTRIWRDEQGNITRAKFSCLGFLLAIADEVGILIQSGQINPSRFDKTKDWPETMESVLQANCNQIAVEESGPGDIFKMQYASVDMYAPIHVAMKTTWETCPHGSIIHAINYNIGAKNPGRVTENRIDISEYNNIISAHRIKNLRA